MSSDYISRQAAIDLVKDVCDAIMSGCGSHYDEETGDEVFDDILEVDAILKCNKEVRIAMKHMPSADVQPVQHGKWIKAQRKGITSYGDGFAECDKCHEVSWLGWNDKYCRNCGADMRGDNDV